MGPYCYSNTAIATIHVQISLHLPKVEMYAERLEVRLTSW